jgi:hypothetical protein
MNPTRKYPRQLLFEDLSSADFSSCGKYRYLLRRWWGPGPVCNMIMLNASSADEISDYATIARCRHRAYILKYGTLLITNLFAYRSTDPRILRTVSDPSKHAIKLHVLKLTKNGIPIHPLYVAYSNAPIAWKPTVSAAVEGSRTTKLKQGMELLEER